MIIEKKKLFYNPRILLHFLSYKFICEVEYWPSETTLISCLLVAHITSLRSLFTPTALLEFMYVKRLRLLKEEKKNEGISPCTLLLPHSSYHLFLCYIMVFRVFSTLYTLSPLRINFSTHFFFFFSFSFSFSPHVAVTRQVGQWAIPSKVRAHYTAPSTQRIIRCNEFF